MTMQLVKARPAGCCQLSTRVVLILLAGSERSLAWRSSGISLGSRGSPYDAGKPTPRDLLELARLVARKERGILELQRKQDADFKLQEDVAKRLESRTVDMAQGQG